MKQDRALLLISLCAKAGKVKSGEFMTEKAVKERKAYLVLAAEDSSENTKKKFRNLCEFYRVPFRCYKDMDTLGRSIGKARRASVAVLDAGLAGRIRESLDAENNTIS